MSQEGGFVGGQSSASASQVQNRKVSCRSLTIKQFREADEPSGDASLEIDQAPVDMIRIVAIIRKVEVEPTKITISIQDSTGSLENLKHWVNEPDNPTPVNYSVGDYVAVYGTSRLYNDRRFLNVIRVDPDISLSFVFFHQMCVLREHWHYTGVKPIGGDSATTQPKEEHKPAQDSMFVDDAPSEAKDSLSARILTALKDEPEGLHVRFLGQKLAMDEMQILQQCEFLNNAGLVYQTDDNTYASST